MAKSVIKMAKEVQDNATSLEDMIYMIEELLEMISPDRNAKVFKAFDVINRLRIR